MKSQVPLTVIGGFLGAGKTTLINHVLSDNGGVRYTVLVNDFGDLAIDESLIESHDGETIALANGCVCCSIGNDLIETLMQILTRNPAPEHIIIEASGVADPRSIAEIGSLDPGLSRDLTIVVVDGAQINEQSNDPLLQDTVDRQLKSADLILINHRNELSQARLLDLESWLLEQNVDAALMRTIDGSLPQPLLDVQDMSRLEKSSSPHADHESKFRSQTHTFQDDANLGDLKRALSGLPPSVLRVKGFVRSEGHVFDVQKAGKRVKSKRAVGKSPGNTNRLVFIGTHEMPDVRQFNDLAAMLK